MKPSFFKHLKILLLLTLLIPVLPGASNAQIAGSPGIWWGDLVANGGAGPSYGAWYMNCARWPFIGAGIIPRGAPRNIWTSPPNCAYSKMTLAGSHWVYVDMNSTRDMVTFEQAVWPDQAGVPNRSSLQMPGEIYRTRILINDAWWIDFDYEMCKPNFDKNLLTVALDPRDPSLRKLLLSIGSVAGSWNTEVLYPTTISNLALGGIAQHGNIYAAGEHLSGTHTIYQFEAPSTIHSIRYYQFLTKSCPNAGYWYGPMHLEIQNGVKVWTRYWMDLGVKELVQRVLADYISPGQPLSTPVPTGSLSVDKSVTRAGLYVQLTWSVS